MKSLKKLFVLWLATFTILTSCTKEEDSRVPSGYPFDNDNELNFTIFDECNHHSKNQQSNIFSKVFDSGTDKLITERKMCDSMFGIISPGCNCAKIDFNENALAFLNGFVYQVSEADFAPRVLINHKHKTYTIELRAYSKTFKGSFLGFPYVHSNFYFTELLIVPKPPDNYIIKTKYYLPATKLE